MRILFCYPWLDLGGAPNTTITLAKGIKDRGHEVYLFTKSGGMCEERAKRAGIPLISAPYHGFLPHLDHLNFKAYRILCKTLNDLRIDLVHAFHLHPYFLSLFAAPPRNIPVVFTAVWFLGDTRFPAYPGRVIFVADEFKNQAEHLFGGYPREMAVIPNRIDLDLYRPGIESNDFARSLGLPTDGWKIAFMSRIESSKANSLIYAMEAARILAARKRPIRLAIAGDGALIGEMRARAERINEETGSTAVRLLGSIADTPRFLSWADITVGIGRCAWEGMSCAKPTMVVGENGLAGIVDAGSVDTLAYHNFSGRNLTAPVPADIMADEIECIMTDVDRYRELASFAHRYANETGNYRRGAERLEEIYIRAIADPPLTREERLRLFVTNVVFGAGYRSYVALRLKARALLGRGRPGE